MNFSLLIHRTRKTITDGFGTGSYLKTL